MEPPLRVTHTHRPAWLRFSYTRAVRSDSTVRRWLLEVIGLLAARAPRLGRALKKIARKGGVVVLLDGTLVRTRRRAGNENRPNYSGKHKAHGLLFVALTDE